MTELKISPEFAKAFIKAQSEMTNPKKDSENPYFKSKYADLGAVRDASLPALNNNGIGVLQATTDCDVKTILLHESGEMLDIGCSTKILYGKPNDPQAQGSGITYARRYGLQSILTLAAEDDDGNKGAEQPKTDKQKLGNIADDDMKQTLSKKNEQDFAALKSIIEACGGIEELEEVRANKENKKIMASLSKYAPSLFEMIKSSVTEMETQFKKEEEDLGKLGEIGK